MKWMPKDEFWKFYESVELRDDVRLDGWCSFEIPETDLREKIGDIEPITDLVGEDNPPGPVSRWYGNLNGIPFILDLHHKHPNGEVATIKHGKSLDTRKAIREAFNNWGSNWNEPTAS